MSRKTQILIATTSIWLGFVLFYSNQFLQQNWTQKSCNSQSRTLTRVVVHMGPHKTGTTMIQEFAHHHIDLLRKDGYEMPEVDNAEKNARGKMVSYSNHVRFAMCFVDPTMRTIYPCDPDRLLHGLDLAAKGRNVFITAEAFDKIDQEGIEMLKSYLSRWSDVTIMIFYRRYYDWLPSVYNEIHKGRTLVQQEKWEESIVDFIFQHSERYHTLHVVSLFNRLQEKFKKESIVLLDYHDKQTKGPQESLFCNIPVNMQQ